MKIRNHVFQNFLVLVYPITFLFQIWGSDSWSTSVNYWCNRISVVFSLMQWHSKSSKLLLLLKIKRDSESERAQNPAQIDSGSIATPGTYLQVLLFAVLPIQKQIDVYFYMVHKVLCSDWHIVNTSCARKTKYQRKVKKTYLRMKSSVKIRDAAILQCLQHANLLKLTKMQIYGISLIHIAKIV